MKALLYKEFKLAVHPICYLFAFLFPLMIIIPNFPYPVGFIYILSAYPILFLGANKGQQSNDLLYSTLLPVRKKDIVLARVVTVSILQFVFMAVMACFLPLGQLFHGLLGDEAKEIGLSFDGFVSTLGFGVIGFAIADLIFFPIYYKNGRSIVMSTLLTILGFAVYIVTFTVVLPSIEGLGWYKDFFCHQGLGVQFAFLGGALLLYFLAHILVYKISAKRLEKVDF